MQIQKQSIIYFKSLSTPNSDSLLKIFNLFLIIIVSSGFIQPIVESYGVIKLLACHVKLKYLVLDLGID
jgi:hypothetical protein